MSRPAPQYGEYATPEEVREALGEHAPPDPAQRLDAVTSTPGAPVRDAVPAGPAATSDRPGSARTPGSPAPLSSAQRWDQFVTIALLLMGMWNTILSTPGMLAFDQAMRSYFAAVEGAPEVTFGEPTRMVGVVMAVLLVGTLIVTAMLAWRRLRAGKLAFWVPLVGAAVAGLIMFIGVTVILFVEPGLYEALSTSPLG